MARRPRGRAARQRRHGARPSRWSRRDRAIVAPAEKSLIRMAGAQAMRIPRSAGLGVLIAVALVLVWRIIAGGYAAFVNGSSPGLESTNAPLEAEALDAQWRARLARNPTDFQALVVLALNLEHQGKVAEAASTMR